MADPATEILFYQLGAKPLEAVLPALVERTLERGWRAVIQSGSEERLEAIDLALWTYSEESFLAHGTRKDGFAAAQPVYLTTGSETPNGAGVRFLIDRAVPESFAGAARLVFLFDGRDPDATADARAHWKAAKAAGGNVTFWKQNDQGRWEKQA